MELDHRNGSSKHSEPEKEADDGGGRGTGSPSDAYPKLNVRIGSRDHFGVNAEMIDGSPSSTSSEPHHVTIVDDIGSSDNLTPNLDDPVNEGVMISSIHIGSPSSSASSNSSSEDLFQVDTNEGSTPIASFIPPDEPQHGDTPPSFTSQENAASSCNPFISELRQEGFPASGLLSTKSEVLHEPRIPITSPPTQSPPIQIMERPEGYDPFRIPSTVFERSASTMPLEWSVASNESLFSIHVGNNSFSRDHAFAISGEFAKSGELLMYSPKPQFGTPVHGSQPLVPIMEMENNRESFQPENSTAASVAPELVVKNQKIKEATKAAAVEAQNEKRRPVAFTSRKSSGLSTHSTGSGDSGLSFAFPLRTKKCACTWPSCYSSNCSWTFCYCKWPSCYCSNCSWAFCYSWNSSRKRWCCFSSNILSDRLRSGSDNAMPVKENHQANDEEVDLQPSPAVPVTPKSDYCGWFGCFSSCCSWSFPYRFRGCCC